MIVGNVTAACLQDYDRLMQWWCHAIVCSFAFVLLTLAFIYPSFDEFRLSFKYDDIRIVEDDGALVNDMIKNNGYEVYSETQKAFACSDSHNPARYTEWVLVRKMSGFKKIFVKNIIV